MSDTQLPPLKLEIEAQEVQNVHTVLNNNSASYGRSPIPGKKGSLLGVVLSKLHELTGLVENVENESKIEEKERSDSVSQSSNIIFRYLPSDSTEDSCSFAPRLEEQVPASIFTFSDTRPTTRRGPMQTTFKSFSYASEEGLPEQISQDKHTSEGDHSYLVPGAHTGEIQENTTPRKITFSEQSLSPSDSISVVDALQVVEDNADTLSSIESPAYFGKKHFVSSPALTCRKASTLTPKPLNVDTKKILQRSFIPTFIAWAGTLPNMWEATNENSPLVTSALQSIWSTLFPNEGNKVNRAIVKYAIEKLQNHINEFLAVEFNSIQEFITDKMLESENWDLSYYVQDALTEILLVEGVSIRKFIFKCYPSALSHNNTRSCVNDFQGIYRSSFIIDGLAHHLRTIKQARRDVPDLPIEDHMRGALGVAATAAQLVLESIKNHNSRDAPMDFSNYNYFEAQSNHSVAISALDSRDYEIYWKLIMKDAERVAKNKARSFLGARSFNVEPFKAVLAMDNDPIVRSILRGRLPRFSVPS